MTKVIVWNCNGANPERMEDLWNIVRLLKITVVVLTEIHRHRVKPPFSRWTVYQTKEHRSRGVALLHSNQITSSSSTTKIDVSARYIRTFLTFPFGTCQFVALYAPADPRQREKFWNSPLAQNLLCHADFIAGDFNFVDMAIRDCNNPNRRDLTLSTLAVTREILSRHVDAAVTHNRFDMTYKDVSRIDRVYYRPPWHVSKFAVLRSSSDHQMIKFTLSHSDALSTKEWRFKHFLVMDEIDRRITTSALEDALESLDDTSWTASKPQLVESLQRAEKRMMKRRKQKFFQAKAMLKKFPKSRNADKWRAHIKMMENLYKKATRTWARVSRSLEKELPCEFLTRRLKSRARQQIVAIKDANGVLQTGSENIAQVFREFYADLYSEQDIDYNVLQTMLESWTHEVDFSYLNEPITMDELVETIRLTKGKKSPGVDGITNVVYKLLPSALLGLLLADFNRCLTTGFVPVDWKIGKVIVLFKKGDITDPANYRPITLLNGDYKLLTLILANRLSRKITELIPNFQIGFMPQRLIYDNILSLDVALHAGTKAAVLDFRKAYDSVSHESLSATLRHLRLPEAFCDVCDSAMCESVATVVVDRAHSRSFNVNRGVKQGDPLSPLLFTLVAELMAKSPQAQAVTTPSLGTEKLKVPLLQYADDTVLFSTTDDGIREWIKVLDQLAKATGLTINKDKTFLVGTSVEEMDGIKKATGDFRYLGFTFSPNGLKNTMPETIAELKRRMVKWRSPKMNIFKKLTILKTYTESAMTFNAFVHSADFSTLEKERKVFLWGRARDEKQPSAEGASSDTNAAPKKKQRVLVSGHRQHRSLHAGGLGLTPYDVRARALQTRLMHRIIFEDEMKIHQMFADQVYHWGAKHRVQPDDTLPEEEYDRDDPPEPKFGTKTLNELFLTWWKCTPSREQPAPVQDIQHRLREIAGLNKRLFTPRQLTYHLAGKNVYLIFRRIHRISHLGLRNFVWRYFQGGLPFPRKECHFCGDGSKLCHEHLFFECERGNVVRRDYTRWMNLMKALGGKTSTITPHSDSAFWSLWGRARSSKAQRLCSAVALWTIWRSSEPNAPSFTHILEQVTQDWFASFNLIKQPKKRALKRFKNEQRMALASALWSFDGSMPYVSFRAKKFLNNARPRTLNQLLARTKRKPNF